MMSCASQLPTHSPASDRELTFMLMWMWAAAGADDSLIPELGPPLLRLAVCVIWQTEIRLWRDEWKPSEYAQVSWHGEKICPVHSDLMEFPIFCTAAGFCRGIFVICAHTRDTCEADAVFSLGTLCHQSCMPQSWTFLSSLTRWRGVPANYFGKGRRQVNRCGKIIDVGVDGGGLWGWGGGMKWAAKRGDLSLKGVG